MRIDSHVHFWRYSPEEYGWIDQPMAAIRRDFLPADAARELSACGLDALVAVQARQTPEERECLLELATESSVVAGVVGWVELASPRVEAELERLGKRLSGVRHIVQAEPDDEFLLRPDFNRGIAALARYDLAYDILIFPRQMPAAI